MIRLTPWHITVEWIFTMGRENIDAYPGLAEDLEEVRKRLDSFSQSPTPQNRLRLEQIAEPFILKSLRAFASERVSDVDWDFLTQEFRTTKHLELADIARLFSEPDSTENRALILIKIWKVVRQNADLLGAIFLGAADESRPSKPEPEPKRWTVSIRYHDRPPIEY
jgi:hypothetical protein